MKKKLSIVILMVFLVTTLFATAANAATGTARVYYYTGGDAVGPGTTSTINSYLTTMGYSSVRSANCGPSIVTLALSSSKVIHILAHGFKESPTSKGGGLQCVAGSADPADWVWADNLSNSMSQAKLIFMEACYSGCTHPVRGRLDTTCRNLGAQSTIAFTSEITAGSDSDGIHYFAQRVYFYLSQGYNVNTSVINAKTNTVNKYGLYYGSDSCVVLGGTTTIS